jgi:hypothetical protein
MTIVSNVEYVLQQEYRSPARVAPARRVAKTRKPNLMLLSWIAPLVLVIVWEALARAGWPSPQVLPAPSKVLQTAWKLMLSGSLLNDLGVSMLRAAAGFAIGGSISFTLGTLVGFSRIAEALIDCSVQIVRAIPFLALAPLVIVWFGVGEAQKIFLVSLGVASPIYINTTLGIRQIEPKLVEFGRVQGLEDDSGINKVEDLIGKSLAVNRSGLGEFLLIAALEKHKVDRSKVKFVYLNPPHAAPALASGKVNARSMWSPTVDIARLYKAHDVFLEGRDPDFQIDYSSCVASRKFAADNPAIVRAISAAYEAKVQWINANIPEAEHLVQKVAKYSDRVRDHFIERKRTYKLFPFTDTNFVAELQTAADWLTERKVPPEKITDADHLASV